RRRPGGFLRRGGRRLPASKTGGPAGVILSYVLLGVLVPLLLLGLISRVRSAVGDQVGGQHRGHLGAGRIVLAQKAWQRRRRHALQQAARTLVAGGAGVREDL